MVDRAGMNDTRILDWTLAEFGSGTVFPPVGGSVDAMAERMVADGLKDANGTEVERALRVGVEDRILYPTNSRNSWQLVTAEGGWKWVLRKGRSVTKAVVTRDTLMRELKGKRVPA